MLAALYAMEVSIMRFLFAVFSLAESALIYAGGSDEIVVVTSTPVATDSSTRGESRGEMAALILASQAEGPAKH